VFERTGARHTIVLGDDMHDGKIITKIHIGLK
jgi:hypothetical protein